MCLLAICMSSLEKCLSGSSAHLPIIFLWFVCVCVCVCVWLSCRSCLYSLEIKPLSVTLFANTFCQSIGCLFILFMVSFAVQKLVMGFNSLNPIYLFLLLFLLPWETELRKYWYSLCQRMFCLYSLVGILWSCLTSKSLSHLEFIFMYDMSVCCDFTDLHAVVQLPQHHLLKRLSFLHCSPLYVLVSFVED